MYTLVVAMIFSKLFHGANAALFKCNSRASSFEEESLISTWVSDVTGSALSGGGYVDGSIYLVPAQGFAFQRSVTSILVNSGKGSCWISGRVIEP